MKNKKWRNDTDNKKQIKLIMGIIAALLVLCCCVAIDYSINPQSTSTYNNTTVEQNIIEYNDTYYPDVNETGKAVMNETVAVKPVADTVTITAKPSCGCNYLKSGKYKYKWYTRTFINHCPKCGKWGTLRNVHKPTAKYEYELTCDMRLGGCDADYCGVCGKDKFSWSHYYIVLAE